MSVRKLDSELLISRVLRIGVYTAATIIACGLILTVVTGSSGYEGSSFPTSIQAVWSGLKELKPAAIISLGLLLLIATPVIRVGLSVFLFIQEQDYLYTGITLLVLVILLFSLMFGKAL